MTRKASLAFLSGGSGLLLVLAFRGGAAAEWLATALVSVFPLALIALGAADRQGRVGRLGAWLAVLALLVVGGLLGALALSTGAGRGLVFGGLPAATALFLYVAGLAALVVTGVAYAVTFPAASRSRDGRQAPRQEPPGEERRP